jgi:peptide deformylase
MILDLVTIEKPANEKFLRQKSKKIDFSKFPKKDLKDLVKKMRMTMKEASGVGLAANQVGYDFRMFVAEYDDKFYAIFNPEIIKFSEEKDELEEGCLSIPKTLGPIERSIKVTLTGQSVEGKNIKIRARGFLARIFQHEIDHLNGILFIDTASQTYKNSGENN